MQTYAKMSVSQIGLRVYTTEQLALSSRCVQQQFEMMWWLHVSQRSHFTLQIGDGCAERASWLVNGN